MFNLRPELPADLPAIRSLLTAAFPTPAEADLVEDLRAAKALKISLVALASNTVVGHIALSPVTLDPARRDLSLWSLAPLAVRPDFQRRGIGRALVHTALRTARDAGCHAVVVLGDPHYYQQFGFRPALHRGLRCRFEAPTDAFAIVEPTPHSLPRRLEATVRFHPAFDRFANDRGPSPTPPA